MRHGQRTNAGGVPRGHNRMKTTLRIHDTHTRIHTRTPTRLSHTHTHKQYTQCPYTHAHVHTRHTTHTHSNITISRVVPVQRISSVMAEYEKHQIRKELKRDKTTAKSNTGTNPTTNVSWHKQPSPHAKKTRTKKFAQKSAHEKSKTTNNGQNNTNFQL